MRKTALFSALIVLTLLLVMSCTGTTPPAPGAAPPPLQVEAANTEGKVIYEKNCSSCHGASGEGTSAGPKIAGHSSSAMKMQVRKPMGMMPAFSSSQISEGDLDKVAAYMSSMMSGAVPMMDWEKAAPEKIHHWMALLAIKNNEVADARHHLEDAFTFVKEPAHKNEMQKALQLIAQNKLHDLEHEIEEMAGGESPSGITMQRFNLQLMEKSIEGKNLPEVKRHTENFMAKATDKQKKIAGELLEKAEKGHFHEAEHELEELIRS